jgi:hypothetical protein
MKIDVEGWEVRMLQGAQQTLSANDAPVLLIEFNGTALKNAGSSYAELYRTLESLGYGLYQIGKKGRTLHHFRIPSAYQSPHNLVAVKNFARVMRRIG